MGPTKSTVLQTILGSRLRWCSKTLKKFLTLSNKFQFSSPQILAHANQLDEIDLKKAEINYPFSFPFPGNVSAANISKCRQFRCVNIFSGNWASTASCIHYGENYFQLKTIWLINQYLGVGPWILISKYIFGMVEGWTEDPNNNKWWWCLGFWQCRTSKKIQMLKLVCITIFQSLLKHKENFKLNDTLDTPHKDSRVSD